jgi:uncharacterized protein YdcH (DUF465 family)
MEVTMASVTDDLRAELSAHNPEYRALLQDHHAHEHRLAELASKAYLSTDEEMEEKRLKKEKLYLKDRMEEIVRERRARVTAQG